MILDEIPLHLGTGNKSIALKTPELRNFCRGLAAGGLKKCKKKLIENSLGFAL